MECPKRKTIRLQTYDYSTPGAYFVTICTQERCCTLSSVRRGDPCGRPSVELTEFGRVVERCFDEVSALYGAAFDAYVIMPNHIHFICRLDAERATARVAPTLGQIVGALKSLSANQCRKAGLHEKLWQRNYYEHVVRNENDYLENMTYIENNPAKWTEDRFYSDAPI